MTAPVATPTPETLRHLAATLRAAGLIPAAEAAENKAAEMDASAARTAIATNKIAEAFDAVSSAVDGADDADKIAAIDLALDALQAARGALAPAVAANDAPKSAPPRRKVGTRVVPSGNPAAAKFWRESGLDPNVPALVVDNRVVVDAWRVILRQDGAEAPVPAAYCVAAPPSPVAVSLGAA